MIARNRDDLAALAARSRAEIAKRFASFTSTLSPADSEHSRVVAGHLGAPADGDTFDFGSVIGVSGWLVASDGTRPVVHFRLDGTLVGAAELTIARPDAASAIQWPGSEILGYITTIGPEVDGVLCQPGTHRLSAALVNSTGEEEFGAANITIRPPRLTRGAIDAPQNLVECRRDRVGVYGWGVIGGVSGRQALVYADGRLVATPTIAVARPDVVEAIGAHVPQECGFWCELDLSEQIKTNVDVTVEILPDLSRVEEPTIHLGPVTVALADPPRERLQGFVERPAIGAPVERDYLSMSGWALLQDGPLAAIEVLLDGIFVGEARIGIDRPDLDALFEEPHAIAAGFEHLVDFRSLPTDQNHVDVEIVAVFPDGERQTFWKQRHRLIASRRKLPTPGESRRRAARAALVRERADATLALLPRYETRELNLLAITHHLGYGGGQLWLSELLERSRAGTSYPCTVVAPADGPLRRDLERLGIAVHINAPVPVDDVEAYEGRVAELELWARALGCNAVLVNTMQCFAGADVAARLDLPFVWAIHESWTPTAYWHTVYPRNQLDPDVQNRAEWLLGQAAALVFEADATRRQYLDYTSSDRTHVVRYGVGVAAIDRYVASTSRRAARSSLDYDEDDQVVLVMGTIEPRKAQLMLAEAFAAVGDDHPRAKLVFVGDMKTQYSRALKTYIDNMRLNDRVRVVPIIKDTFAWYRAADLLACASDIESLPRSVLEAMNFGVPILATSVFGLGELLDDGTTGVLFEPRNLTAASAALHRALSLSPDELTELGRAGRSLARDRHDSNGYADVIPAMLRQLIANPTLDPAGNDDS
jgi:D-inositol-3-phosphate glycosyltransferase